MKPRLGAVAAVVCIGGGLVVPAASAGPAVASAPDHGWAAVPAAARGPIAAVLARDQREAASVAVGQTTLSAPGEAANDAFGTSVAVSGTTIVVGEPFHTVGSHTEQGVAYVFQRPATGWKGAHQTATLTVSDGITHDRFGFSVAIEGSTIVVGAVQATVDGHAGQGAAYVYRRPAKGWTTTSHPAAVLTDSAGAAGSELGYDLALDGTTIVVGDPDFNDFAGLADVYVAPAGGWQTTSHPTATLTRFGSLAFDEFGLSVAVEGSTIVVGAPDQDDTGAAYIFQKPTDGPWTSTANARFLVSSGASGAVFGLSVAISGTTVVVAASEQPVDAQAKAGAVYVFRRPTTGWGVGNSASLTATATLTESIPTAQDELGTAVAIEGKTVLASSPDHMVGGAVEQGAIYRFIEPTIGWSSESQTDVLVGAGGHAGDQFGYGMAATGSTIVAGATGRTSTRGTAYVFAPRPPTLSAVKQAHKSWHLGTNPRSVNPAHPPRGGTSFRFALSQSATISLVFAEKHGKHLVKRGTLSVHGKAGANAVYFAGKISHGKHLTPGHCKVTITATNRNGTSRSRTLRFTTKP
ncbi:MAG TPA: FG-GAP repeat protein [Mycobacteriales bacterium]|nr:FG-GAP repeat protein [Mycobacteriales bacterium]